MIVVAAVGLVYWPLTAWIGFCAVVGIVSAWLRLGNATTQRLMVVLAVVLTIGLCAPTVESNKGPRLNKLVLFVFGFPVVWLTGLSGAWIGRAAMKGFVQREGSGKPLEDEESTDLS